ncbi:hypothetical protein D9615_000847 [Tricholomella constricta]|uniref:Ricin B lectin domain-containing protein n=1 Tax=Tricholomella constricta TaxID=117010 RepID=A0A8H5MBX2_9AGAR|nr:hypothetical protein D9615_000847 [Tricholomella constricta]
MVFQRGVYRISNSTVPIVVDLNRGDPTNGTAVTAWSDNGGLNQLWLAEETGEADTFTLRNLAGGTYMDLARGSAAEQTNIEGWSRTGDNQKWTIKRAIDGTSWKIQNYASKTFADLYNGGDSDGTPIYGWTGTWDDDNSHQKWNFQRMSATSAEVTLAIRNNPHLAHDYRGYLLDGEYLILSADVWHQVWATTGLGQGNKVWRSEIFDCDDFAVTMKAAVAAWGADNIRADNCALLCGIMLGVNPNDPTDAHAYNFNLTNDHTGVIFYEPQTDQFLNDIGYNAYLAFF